MRERIIRNCKVCQLEFTSDQRHNLYCSLLCHAEEKKRIKVEEMLALGFDNSSQCRRAKRYIIDTKGHMCEICKLTEWLGQPIPLTLDHINNNPEDSSLINLRVICPNCDRLTPNFGSKNRGNGRASRRQRYQEGKSY